jgi:hypothetical protein
MFRALLCPSSGAHQTAVAASGFRMNVEVEVFSAVVGLLTKLTFEILRNFEFLIFTASNAFTFELNRY